jgi:hypothetical protein
MITILEVFYSVYSEGSWGRAGDSLWESWQQFGGPEAAGEPAN